MQSQSPILIIGKHGKTGARVCAQLTALGLPVRAVSRSTALSFDWNNPETWPAVLENVRSVYLTYQPDLAVPRAEVAIRQFVALAKEAGVEHIVLLSGRGEDGAQRAEQVLIRSGLDWNVVRASWFMQNFSESFMAAGIEGGVLALPAGDTAEPFVDADDIADVAVAALTRTELRNQLFEVTGPEALTFAQCVARIGKATGRDIQFQTVPIDAYIDHLAEEGIPDDYQWLLRELFTVVFDGRNLDFMHGVEQALGRPAGNFDAYIEKTITQGLWPRTSEPSVVEENT